MAGKIQLRDVRQVFSVRGAADRKPHEFVALDGLDLEVDDGEFLTLVGPSGCGKSTVLDLISGLSTPASGSVVVDGQTGHRARPGPRGGLPAVHAAALAYRARQHRVRPRGGRPGRAGPSGSGSRGTTSRWSG